MWKREEGLTKRVRRPRSFSVCIAYFYSISRTCVNMALTHMTLYQIQTFLAGALRMSPLKSHSLRYHSVPLSALRRSIVIVPPGVCPPFENRKL